MEGDLLAKLLHLQSHQQAHTRLCRRRPATQHGAKRGRWRCLLCRATAAAAAAAAARSLSRSRGGAGGGGVGSLAAEVEYRQAAAG
jgi:hypothetical protein